MRPVRLSLVCARDGLVTMRQARLSAARRVLAGHCRSAAGYARTTKMWDKRQISRPVGKHPSGFWIRIMRAIQLCAKQIDRDGRIFST